MPLKILDSQILPQELWDPEFVGGEGHKTGLVKLPLCLSQAYSDLIVKSGLVYLANSRDPNNPPVGGLSQDETDKHFAQAFDGSAARSQLALMDPLNLATKASNNLVRMLAGNRIRIADLPCGAGAATFSLLCTIAQLRASGILPREPLDVHLVAGEISGPARVYAEKLVIALKIPLEEQAINLIADFSPWDVTDKLSNTAIIGKIIKASNDGGKNLLVIANFNGFIIKERKQKEALPQLTELLCHCSADNNSYAIWIEPNMKRATALGGLFDWLKTQAKTIWTRFVKIDMEDDEFNDGRNDESFAMPQYNTRFQLPLQPAEDARACYELFKRELSIKVTKASQWMPSNEVASRS